MFTTYISRLGLVYLFIVLSFALTQNHQAAASGRTLNIGLETSLEEAINGLETAKEVVFGDNKFSNFDFDVFFMATEKHPQLTHLTLCYADLTRDNTSAEAGFDFDNARSPAALSPFSGQGDALVRHNATLLSILNGIVNSSFKFFNLTDTGIGGEVLEMISLHLAHKATYLKFTLAHPHSEKFDKFIAEVASSRTLRNIDLTFDLITLEQLESLLYTTGHMRSVCLHIRSNLFKKLGSIDTMHTRVSNLVSRYNAKSPGLAINTWAL